MRPDKTFIVLIDGTFDCGRLARAVTPPSGWQVVFSDLQNVAIARARAHDVSAVIVAIAAPQRTDVLAQLAHEAPHVARMVVVHASEAALSRDPRAHETVVATATDAAIYEALQRVRLIHHQSTLPILDRLAGAISRLPALPAAYRALTEAIEAPTAHVAHIADVVETDPVLALRVLQLANSAFFGAGRRITTVHDAISRLGLNTVRMLVLRCHVFATFGLESSAFSHEHFHDYALRVARLARSFAQDDKDAAFTAGLLLDIGCLVIGAILPDEFTRISEIMRETGASAEAIERVVLGTSHAELGAYLLDRWRLPFRVVEAVAYHHRPRESCGHDRALLACVHAADALVSMQTSGEANDCIDHAFIAEIGRVPELPRWRALAWMS